MDHDSDPNSRYPLADPGVGGVWGCGGGGFRGFELSP